jgi:hypothetical protein
LIREVAILHLTIHGKLRACDLVNVNLRDTTRHRAASPLRTSDIEEPDVWSDASCIEFDDGSAIAEPFNV